MQLNPYFISNIREIYGETGITWLKDLPNQLKQFSILWNFRLLDPLPDLSYNFVGRVKMTATGEAAVIKVGPPGGSLVNEIHWLNCIEKGVPKIYAFDEVRNAYLMEHLVPGDSLKRLVKIGKDDDATKIICQTIRNLQSQQHNEFNFQHLSELPKALSILKGRIDANLLSQAESLFHDLTNDRTRDVLLHGDLHHDNILSSGSGWKAIDPHGYMGDPAAEVGAMVRNPFDYYPTDRPLSKTVERRLKIMTDELPFDAQSIKSWAFCMTILSVAWTFEDHAKLPEDNIEIAKAIYQTKI